MSERTGDVAYPDCWAGTIGDNMNTVPQLE
jgi:hypothetical protein